MRNLHTVQIILAIMNSILQPSGGSGGWREWGRYWRMLSLLHCFLKKNSRDQRTVRPYIHIVVFPAMHVHSLWMNRLFAHLDTSFRKRTNWQTYKCCATLWIFHVLIMLKTWTLNVSPEQIDQKRKQRIERHRNIWMVHAYVDICICKWKCFWMNVSVFASRSQWNVCLCGWVCAYECFCISTDLSPHGN